MQLRPYQISCLNKIWEDIQTNYNVLIQGPTAFGKTIAFSKLIQRFLREQLQGRCLILVDREVLVKQSKEKLLRVAPELTNDIGICCSSIQPKKELEHRVTIASRQTLINQLNSFTPVNIIILDECHLARIPQEDDLEKDYDQFQSIIYKLREYNPKTRLIGFSATPFRLSQGYIYGNKNTKGCKPYFPELNYKIGITELQEQGFLAPLKAKTIVSDKAKADIASCKIQAGEFSLAMLSDIMTCGIHIQSAVDAWKEYAIDRKKTLAFCVTIEHAEKLAEAFNSNGIDAVAIHSQLEDDDLSEYMNSLDNGNHKVYCSVAKLTTGLDVIDIDCVLGARATKSTSLLIQCIGRGLRIAPNKTDCLFLDLVGNIQEHFGNTLNLDKPRVFYRLTKKSDKSEEEKINDKQCPECSAIVHKACRVCPDCEYAFNFKAEIHEQPELMDVVIGPDIRTFSVTNMQCLLHQKKDSERQLMRVKLDFEDVDADYRNRFKSVSIWCCFPGDGYEGFAVKKMKENLSKLSCGELPIINDDGSETWPETAIECVESAQDLLYQPDIVTVDMSGKWPELKSFSYEVVEEKQEAFGGQFEYKIDDNLDSIPF